MAGEDQLDLIEIACFHCEKAFAVCIRDYRGHRYCGPRCQELGYRSRKREAGRRYQGTPNGRERHRRRQKELRDRRVTHGATVQARSPGATVLHAAAEPHEERPDGRSRGRSPESTTAHRLANTDEGRGSDAASSAGARVSSSCESPQTSLTESVWNGAAEAEFLWVVLDYYLWLPGTATVAPRHDRACARALFRRGVPLEVVKDAMAVAVARRTFLQCDPLPRVRALQLLPAGDRRACWRAPASLGRRATWSTGCAPWPR
jgi:hypothetical protein